MNDIEIQPGGGHKEDFLLMLCALHYFGTFRSKRTTVSPTWQELLDLFSSTLQTDLNEFSMKRVDFSGHTFDFFKHYIDAYEERIKTMRRKESQI